MSARDAVRWGIISTAAIAETAFVPAVNQTRRGELVAVASRSREKAETFAATHGIPRVFDDYASLLASDEIDAVYNPLPNTMHREWTEAAAANGKHVFCEKPLATTAADAEAMVCACAQAGVVFFEAFVFLYHPQTLRLRQLLDEGVIGELLQLSAHMIYAIARPTDNIRMNRDIGGGSLYDGGSYPITFSRFAFAEEPCGIQSTCVIDPDYGVDTRASLLLEFPGGRTASIQAGFDAHGGQGAMLMGSEGAIEVSRPYHPAEQSSFVIRTRNCEETVEFDNGVVPFTPAIERFHDCVLDGVEPRLTAANAVGTLKVIESVLAAAR